MTTKETLTIAHGGPLEIVGEGDTAALLLDGTPIQMTFLREIGSTMRYIVGRDSSPAEWARAAAVDAALRERMETGVRLGVPLSEQFAPLLERLASGTYELDLISLAEDGIDVVTAGSFPIAETRDAGRYEHIDTYGGLAGTIVRTQLTIDRARVRELAAAIEAGARPIVAILTTPRFDLGFMIDGHHKLLAYEELGREAPALRITRLDAAPIATETGVQWIEEHCRDADTFVEAFRDRSEE